MSKKALAIKEDSKSQSEVAHDGNMHHLQDDISSAKEEDLVE